MNLNVSSIGILGFQHYEFFKQNHPTTIGVMRLTGTLKNYLSSSPRLTV